jgi:hypothetical protein
LLRRGARKIFGEGVKRGRDMGVGTGDKLSTILMVLIYVLPVTHVVLQWTDGTDSLSMLV